MARSFSLSEAKGKIARFCALRERSPKEVQDKLAAWGLLPADIIKLLSELEEQGFVDEQRFANAFCHDKFEFNSWGKLKIKAHIYTHQIGEDAIAKALHRIDESSYKDRLATLAERKWSMLNENDLFRKRQKVYAFLANRGFENHLIQEALAKMSH